MGVELNLTTVVDPVGSGGRGRAEGSADVIRPRVGQPRRVGEGHGLAGVPDDRGTVRWRDRQRRREGRRPVGRRLQDRRQRGDRVDVAVVDERDLERDDVIHQEVGRPARHGEGRRLKVDLRGVDVQGAGRDRGRGGRPVRGDDQQLVVARRGHGRLDRDGQLGQAVGSERQVLPRDAADDHAAVVDRPVQRPVDGERLGPGDAGARLVGRLEGHRSPDRGRGDGSVGQGGPDLAQSPRSDALNSCRDSSCSWRAGAVRTTAGRAGRRAVVKPNMDGSFRAHCGAKRARGHNCARVYRWGRSGHNGRSCPVKISATIGPRLGVSRANGNQANV